MVPAAASTVLAATRALTKQYPGTLALDSVDFNVRAHEVHALLGQNGAGKSTLIKILSGAVEPTSGSVTILGREVTEFRPDAMRTLGIATIYQEFTLVPQLTIAENLALSREPLKAGFVLDRAEMRRRAELALEEFHLDLRAGQLVGDLSIGEQQLLEIAKAIKGDARVLILDEPTAALTASESERLFEFIHRLRESGCGIIYISHRLDETEMLADRVTVLRNGTVAAEFTAGAFTRESLTGAMLGRGPGETRAPSVASGQVGPVRLEARALTTDQAPPFDITVHGGEIVGLAGLLGSGRTEMMRALFGADRVRGGVVIVDGVPSSGLTPAAAWRAGIALAPEDRKSQGLFLTMTLAENMGMASPPTAFAGILDRGLLARKAKAIIGLFSVRATSERAHADALSGGNQQKLVLGRALFSDASILLIDEPTRGVDVGAKVEIWDELRRLAGEGRAIVVVSSELEDFVGNVDRVLVVRERQIVDELRGEQIFEEALLRAVEGDSWAAPTTQGGNT